MISSVVEVAPLIPSKCSRIEVSLSPVSATADGVNAPVYFAAPLVTRSSSTNAEGPLLLLSYLSPKVSCLETPRSVAAVALPEATPSIY